MKPVQNERTRERRPVITPPVPEVRGRSPRRSKRSGCLPAGGRTIRAGLGVLILLSIYSCGNSKRDKMEDPALVNEQLTQMNRKRVEIESREINEFIARHHFNMRQTGTGLRFQIYERGKGVHPATRDEVKIRYKVFLLDGTFCYSTDSLGPVRFTIGINEQVRGLEEGLFLMVPGDKARLIVPAHLGYGMTGDGMHIPPESALYYDVELISINQ